MAVTTIAALTGTSAVSGESTAFTTTGRGFWAHGSGFSYGETATIMRVGPSGEWEPATNERGQIFVSAYPNTVFVDLPAGTYRVNKTATANESSFGWEEE